MYSAKCRPSLKKGWVPKGKEGLSWAIISFFHLPKLFVTHLNGWRDCYGSRYSKFDFPQDIFWFPMLSTCRRQRRGEVEGEWVVGAWWQRWCFDFPALEENGGGRWAHWESNKIFVFTPKNREFKRNIKIFRFTLIGDTYKQVIPIHIFCICFIYIHVFSF